MRNSSLVPGQHSAGKPFSQAQHAPRSSSARRQGRAGTGLSHIHSSVRPGGKGRQSGHGRDLCTFLGPLRAGSPCVQLLVLPPSSRTVTTLFVPLPKPWRLPDTLVPAVDFLPACFSSSWSRAADDSPSLQNKLCDRKALAALPWGSARHSQHRKHKS